MISPILFGPTDNLEPQKNSSSEANAELKAEDFASFFNLSMFAPPLQNNVKLTENHVSCENQTPTESNLNLVLSVTNVQLTTNSLQIQDLSVQNLLQKDAELPFEIKSSTITFAIDENFLEKHLTKPDINLPVPIENNVLPTNDLPTENSKIFPNNAEITFTGKQIQPQSVATQPIQPQSVVTQQINDNLPKQNAEQNSFKIETNVLADKDKIIFNQENTISKPLQMLSDVDISSDIQSKNISPRQELIDVPHYENPILEHTENDGLLPENNPILGFENGKEKIVLPTQKVEGFIWQQTEKKIIKENQLTIRLPKVEVKDDSTKISLNDFVLKKKPIDEKSINSEKILEKIGLPKIQPDIKPNLKNNEKNEKVNFVNNDLPENIKIKNTSENKLKEENTGLNLQNERKVLENTKLDVSTQNQQNFSENNSETAKSPNEIKISDKSFSEKLDSFPNTVNKIEKTSENEVQIKTLSPKVFEQIEPRLAETIGLIRENQDRKTLKIKLNPEELGKVEITLERNSDGKMNAHFQIESEKTRQILSENFTQLRNSLENSGQIVGKIEISYNSFSSGGNENRQNHSHESVKTENQFTSQNSFDDDSNLQKEEANRLVSLRA